MADRPNGHENGQQQGFTAVLCTECEHDTAAPVNQALREIVRRTAGGILVRAGCPMGPLWCHARRAGGGMAGALVLVQPCTEARAPAGPAITIGPLRGEKDLVTLGCWLDHPPLHPEKLPRRLLGGADRGHRAGSN